MAPKTALRHTLKPLSEWFVRISPHSLWGYSSYLAVITAAIAWENITMVKHWQVLSNKERWMVLYSPHTTTTNTCPWAEKGRMGVGWWSIWTLLLLKKICHHHFTLIPESHHHQPPLWSNSRVTILTQLQDVKGGDSSHYVGWECLPPMLKEFTHTVPGGPCGTSVCQQWEHPGGRQPCTIEGVFGVLA